MNVPSGDLKGKIKKSITPVNTYILSQHVLQMTVRSTLTVFVLSFFFFCQFGNFYFTYVFIVIFSPFYCKQHLVQTSTVNHNPSKLVFFFLSPYNINEINTKVWLVAWNIFLCGSRGSKTLFFRDFWTPELNRLRKQLTVLSPILEPRWNIFRR